MEAEFTLQSEFSKLKEEVREVLAETIEEVLQSEFSKLKEEVRRSEDETFAYASQLMKEMKEELLSELKTFSDSSKKIHVYWDRKNCPLPKDVDARKIAGNIEQAIRLETGIKYEYTLTMANTDPKKNGADLDIIVDMHKRARKNPGSTILVISEDEDFTSTLLNLGDIFHHPIFLAIPARKCIGYEFKNHAEKVWCWDNLARGLVTEKYQRRILSNSLLMLPTPQPGDEYSLLKNELVDLVEKKGHVRYDGLGEAYKTEHKKELKLFHVKKLDDILMVYSDVLEADETNVFKHRDKNYSN